MTDIYVVDTHTLSWYLAGNEKLGAVAKKALHDSAVRIVVPTLVLGELVSMIERGKTAIGPADGVVSIIGRRIGATRPADRCVHSTDSARRTVGSVADGG